MPAGEVRVWSLLVRLFHWSLVATVALAWITSEVGRRLHEPTGWTMVALLAVRLVWGVVGRVPAERFASFVRGPRAVMAYAGEVLRGHAPRYLGHNPLGGWMVIALIAALAAVATTGWLMTTDAFFGNEAVEELHEGLAEAALVLVALHVGGVIYTGWHQRENLVRAMLSGRKRAPGSGDIEA